MINIKVTPILYKLKTSKNYRRGIMVLNRNRNLCTVIDVHNMTTIKFNDEVIENWHSLDETCGCTIFNLK